MTPRFPGVILAGGKSLRMGEPKALLPFAGARLIDHVAARVRPQVTALMLNANDPAITLPGATRISDHYPGQPGPLAGVHSALRHVQDAGPDAPSHVLIVPVDSPFIPSDFAARLAEHLADAGDVAIAASGGYIHPVIGLWPLALLNRLETWLNDPPNLKVRAFLGNETVRIIDFPVVTTTLGPLDPFFNINRPEDLDFALRLHEAAVSH
jgi:molybdenum cofactor guanylyltransferase